MFHVLFWYGLLFIFTFRIQFTVMKKYIVILRGVMPTGKNKVPMAQLREKIKEGGFEGVKTYIQSGNVLLKTNLTRAKLEKEIHQLIEKHFGGDLVIIGRNGQNGW